ncbi:MAG: hypothetical protein JO102_04995, partial [Elusimicrobia bacterium]|nr:hypothetical protein [Elusimicrobiota bacterium]
QAHIAAALARLSTALDVIGLEGAFHSLNADLFRAFPNRSIVSAMTAAFVSAGRLGGPSKALIDAASPGASFIGVDDRAAYERNVAAYRAGNGVAADARRQIAASAARLNALPARREVRAFADTRTDYREGRLELAAYLRRLTAGSDEVEFPVERFLQAADMERRMDFDRIESERRTIVATLVGKLTDAETEDLLKRSAAYRLGRIGYADYYRSFQALCARKGVDLALAPAFDDYIRYVFLADGIQPETLFDAVDRLERARLEGLAPTADERRWLDEREMAALAGRLIKFDLTPRDWGRYQEIKSRGIEPAVPLGPFEDFYRIAESRSERMVENLLAAPATVGRALVAGGFHTPSLINALKRRGIPFVVVTPKLAHADAGSATSYLNVFNREKTPIERIFSGEKLFLAPANVIAGAGGAAAPLEGELAARIELRDLAEAGAGALPAAPKEVQVLEREAERATLSVRGAVIEGTWTEDADEDRAIDAAPVGGTRILAPSRWRVLKAWAAGLRLPRLKLSPALVMMALLLAATPAFADPSHAARWGDELHRSSVPMDALAGLFKYLLIVAGAVVAIWIGRAVEWSDVWAALVAAIRRGHELPDSLKRRARGETPKVVSVRRSVFMIDQDGGRLLAAISHDEAARVEKIAADSGRWIALRLPRPARLIARPSNGAPVSHAGADVTILLRSVGNGKFVFEATDNDDGTALFDASNIFTNVPLRPAGAPPIVVTPAAPRVGRWQSFTEWLRSRPIPKPLQELVDKSAFRLAWSRAAAASRGLVTVGTEANGETSVMMTTMSRERLRRLFADRASAGESVAVALPADSRLVVRDGNGKFNPMPVAGAFILILRLNTAGDPILDAFFDGKNLVTAADFTTRSPPAGTVAPPRRSAPKRAPRLAAAALAIVLALGYVGFRAFRSHILAGRATAPTRAAVRPAPETVHFSSEADRLLAALAERANNPGVQAPLVDGEIYQRFKSLFEQLQQGREGAAPSESVRGFLRRLRDRGPNDGGTQALTPRQQKLLQRALESGGRDEEAAKSLTDIVSRGASKQAIAIVRALELFDQEMNKTRHRVERAQADLEAADHYRSSEASREQRIDELANGTDIALGAGADCAIASRGGKEMRFATVEDLAAYLESEKDSVGLYLSYPSPAASRALAGKFNVSADGRVMGLSAKAAPGALRRLAGLGYYAEIWIGARGEGTRLLIRDDADISNLAAAVQAVQQAAVERRQQNEAAAFNRWLAREHALTELEGRLENDAPWAAGDVPDWKAMLKGVPLRDALTAAVDGNQVDGEPAADADVAVPDLLADDAALQALLVASDPAEQEASARALSRAAALRAAIGRYNAALDDASKDIHGALGQNPALAKLMATPRRPSFRRLAEAQKAMDHAVIVLLRDPAARAHPELAEALEGLAHPAALRESIRIAEPNGNSGPRAALRLRLLQTILTHAPAAPAKDAATQDGTGAADKDTAADGAGASYSLDGVAAIAANAAQNQTPAVDTMPPDGVNPNDLAPVPADDAGAAKSAADSTDASLEDPTDMGSLETLRGPGVLTLDENGKVIGFE